MTDLKYGTPVIYTIDGKEFKGEFSPFGFTYGAISALENGKPAYPKYNAKSVEWRVEDPYTAELNGFLDNVFGS